LRVSAFLRRVALTAAFIIEHFPNRKHALVHFSSVQFLLVDPLFWGRHDGRVRRRSGARCSRVSSCRASLTAASTAPSTLWYEGFVTIAERICARAVEFVARRHVYDDVLDSWQLEILNPEVCLRQSPAVWTWQWGVHSVGSVSSQGEQILQGCEIVRVGAPPRPPRGSGVVDSEPFFFKNPCKEISNKKKI
jgi:hypothetical protein